MVPPGRLCSPGSPFTSSYSASPGRNPLLSEIPIPILCQPRLAIMPIPVSPSPTFLVRLLVLALVGSLTGSLTGCAGLGRSAPGGVDGAQADGVAQGQAQPQTQTPGQAPATHPVTAKPGSGAQPTGSAKVPAQGGLAEVQTPVKGPEGSTGAKSDVDAAGEARWRTTGEALGLTTKTDQSGAPAFTTDGLEKQVAERCGSGGNARRTAYLPGLVRELYAAGIPPAAATEALIRADCGTLADVVRTMIAAGGEPTVTPVVNRALFLAGPRAGGIIEAAASAGLQRDLGGLASPGGDIGRPAHGANSFAMAYFSSGSGGLTGGPATETAGEAASLYNLATPGYGVYTFLVLGKGFPDLPEADLRRYRELLRLIQTYVLAADKPTAGPDAKAHSFLVAVYPGRQGKPLVEQTGSELSAGMRSGLAEYLQATGEGDLAQRLTTAPGPFLVSAPEPRLIPTGRTSSRLVADLSGLAPEYLYPLVDAYDRPIQGDGQDRAGGLEAIRGRLVPIFATGGNGPGSPATGGVSLVGGETPPVTPVAVSPATEVAVALPKG